MNTIWQTTSTPSAMSAAATTPHSCETRLTASAKRATSLDAEGLVDQLLAVRYVLAELRVRALARHLHPFVVLRRRERHHLDVVVLENLDHFVVEPLCLAGKEFLRLAPRLRQHVLLLLVQAAEALLLHEHRLVHEP